MPSDPAFHKGTCRSSGRLARASGPLRSRSCRDAPLHAGNAEAFRRSGLLAGIPRGSCCPGGPLRAARSVSVLFRGLPPWLLTDVGRPSPSAGLAGSMGRMRGRHCLLPVHARAASTVGSGGHDPCGPCAWPFDQGIPWSWARSSTGVGSFPRGGCVHHPSFAGGSVFDTFSKVRRTLPRSRRTGPLGRADATAVLRCASGARGRGVPAPQGRGVSHLPHSGGPPVLTRGPALAGRSRRSERPGGAVARYRGIAIAVLRGRADAIDSFKWGRSCNRFVRSRSR
jgi:hypothetical protein